MKKKSDIIKVKKKLYEWYCDYCEKLIISNHTGSIKYFDIFIWENKDCCHDCYKKFKKEKQSQCTHKFTKFDISVSILYHKSHDYDIAILICEKCDFEYKKMTGENFWCGHKSLGNEIEFDKKQKQLLDLITSWNDIEYPSCDCWDCQ